MLETLRAGPRLSRDAFADVTDRAVREAFKWNVHDGASTRLCDYPLVVDARDVNALADVAVRLSREAEAADRELLERPLVAACLGIPPSLVRAARRARDVPALRYARYDFHPTTDGGVAITEGNLELAAGWNEASAVTALFGAHVTDAHAGGDPGALLADRIAARIGRGGVVGIMHLTRYSDDHQIARYVQHVLAQRGLEAIFFDPTQLGSVGARAAAFVGEERQPLDAIFRFFPAEWACRLPNRRAWFAAATRPGTVWVNPLASVFSQSKRFPLVWRRLEARPSTWQAYLPETRGPAFAPRDWVLKPALGHEGFEVTIPGVATARDARWRWRRARLWPWGWAAQRRFEATAVATPDGPRYPCVGVYVIDGQPVGLYGRVAPTPLIDDHAQDVVVLIGR